MREQMTEETASSMAVDWTVAGRVLTKDIITTTDRTFRPTFYTEQGYHLFSTKTSTVLLRHRNQVHKPIPRDFLPTIASVLPHRTAPHHTIPRPDKAEQSKTLHHSLQTQPSNLPQTPTTTSPSHTPNPNAQTARDLLRTTS